MKDEVLVEITMDVLGLMYDIARIKLKAHVEDIVGPTLHSRTSSLHVRDELMPTDKRQVKLVSPARRQQVDDGERHVSLALPAKRVQDYDGEGEC